MTSITHSSNAKSGEIGPSSDGRVSRPDGKGLRVDEMVAALRALPYGGIDDSTRNFALPPAVRATVSPVLNSLRWGAVTFGVVFAAPKAAAGDLQVVITLTACVFITCWRTAIPIRLASNRVGDRIVAFTDIAILSAAVGVSGGLSSPFIYCVLAAVTVVAFGWGGIFAAGGIATALVAMALGSESAGRQIEIGSQEQLGSLAAIIIAAGIAAFARSRLLEAENKRASLAGRVGALSETNDLLTLLNGMARSLPTSLNVREAMDGVRRQIIDTFHPDLIALIEYVDGSDEWVPKLADHCELQPTMRFGELPTVLQNASRSTIPTLVSDIPTGYGISQRSRSGVYARLVARGNVVGVLGIEHHSPGHFTERDQRLLAGLADVVALTFDNARWFGRLRSLGAESERVRIARDLHDRLGQWLTYISYELERINLSAPDPELLSLHADVTTALEELRETLRQLRTGISEGEPLSKAGAELVDRLRKRSNLDIEFVVTGDHLPVPVENEVLRIMQEALNNVEKHSKASVVRVTWETVDGVGTLTVTDDGRGFDQSTGVRDSAYGLVGMRERADVIGARLAITSMPGEGTTVTVTTAPALDGERQGVQFQ